MNTQSLPVLLLFCFQAAIFLNTLPCRAQAPAQETATADELTPEAAEAVEVLRKQLPENSEAMAMLESILSGHRLGAEDGWFPLAKAKTNLDWPYAVSSFDHDNNQAVESTEFTGSKEDFARLDRSNDGKLTEADFDWSQHSLTRTPGFMLFFLADRDTNGKVTKNEFSALFDKLSGGEDFLALDDLRDQLSPPPPSNSDHSPDRPTRSTLVLGLKQQEVGSLQPGQMWAMSLLISRSRQ